jgi:hypothetical protein
MARDYTYGAHPQVIGPFDVDWSEYMHYLYLPVVMREWDPGDVLHHGHIRLPPNLEFLRGLVEQICDAENVVDDDGVAQQYVYVSARRGFAHPGNALNRPGWHADGFGSDDLNYIWSDSYPTMFAVGEFGEISEDHVVSAQQFEERIADSLRGPVPGMIRVYQGDPYIVYRLDPSVVHATAEIPPPGGDRSFFKISVSPDRYNLRGNSHNYLFDYDWYMYTRSEVRNDPIHGGGDSGPQEQHANT